jgi:hypothetical protein
MKEFLEIVANLAAILTAVMATFFFCQYHCRRHNKSIKLEDYLRKDKANAKPPLTGKRTVVHLMGKLKFTEDEVFQACFQSKHVTCKTVVDSETGRATELLFEYDENPKN